MIYNEYSPTTNKIKQHVHKYWHIKLKQDFIKEKILPAPVANVIINVNKPFTIYDSKEQKPIPVNYGVVSGIQERFYSVESEELMQSIGIEFKPHGLYPFTSYKMSQLGNAIIPVENVFKNFNAIHSKLTAEHDITIRLQLIEDYLEKLFWVEHENHKVIDSIISTIEKDPDIALKDVADKFGYSQKHIITLIKSMTGLTPKSLALIYKFQAHVIQFKIEKPKSWSWFALANNVKYQSQFSKKFTEFTGVSPQQYLNSLQKR